uniref:Upstream binding transcription factor n=1 Tax=Phasianus colchicus TaxID=9054 RepID=A0A669PWJ7_PHACC
MGDVAASCLSFPLCLTPNVRFWAGSPCPRCLLPCLWGCSIPVAQHRELRAEPCSARGWGLAGFGCTAFGCSVFTPLPSPQKHPDFPKKPLTPYFRFFMEKRAKYAKLHPEMSNLDLTKILSKKYKELPEKKKVRVWEPAGSLCASLPRTRDSSSPSTTSRTQLLPGLGVTRVLVQPRQTSPAPCPASQDCRVGVEVHVCLSVRPFQTALGGGFAVGWDVLGLRRSSHGAGWPCWQWHSHLGSVCHQQQRAGVQSPPCCSPTSGTSPGLPVGWDSRSGWVPASRVGNPRLGAVLGLQPFRGGGASPACGISTPVPPADVPLPPACPQMKYIQDFQREKQEFERNLARFREDHPDLIQNAKKSDVPEKPKTPQQLWYNHEKKIYLKVRPDEIMRDYIQKHPELNLSEEGITRSTLTKAERQLKDKFDGRPTKPPPNSYSLYCAELMANMKDVPSTERMVLCSQQWKLLSQKEKDAYHKKCDQKKKDYEIELLRFLESLPEEEQQRVLGEEKMLGSNRKGATSPASKKSSPETGKASSEKPKRPISAMFIFSEEKRKQLQEERPELSESELTRLLARMWNDLSEKKKAKYKAREAAMKAQSEKKHGSDKEERGKLPESPKTAEEIWQQSVIGDYLARFKNDRGKALKAMEATWNNMEKKEKLMWIKKAAEDQKRYERELSEMRAPPCSTNSAKKVKFQGEPKKPPMNGYQKFSQELLSNGELNHLPLKERMVEIGSRWQRISQGQKDHYKKLAEEQQKQYKVHLDIWLKSLSPQERAAYKEHTSNKRKSIGKIRGPNPKMKPTMQSKSVSSALCLPGLGGTFGWGSQGVSCSLAIRWHSKTRALPKPVPKNPPGVSGDPAAICDSTEGLLGDVGSTNGESLQPGGVGAVPSCFVAGGRCWWPRTAAPITNQPATNPPQCSQQESEDDDDDEEDEDDDDEDEDDDDDNGDSSEEGGDSSESSSEEESEDGDECECRVSEQRQSFAPVQLQSHYAGWRWGQKPCPCLVLAPGQVRCPHPK